ncbi:MAG TPA: hypothetical protein VIK18_22545 [Pirellulales bacterium]
MINLLIEWGHPDPDDDVEATSPIVLSRACRLICKLRESQLPVPSRIARDANGGLSIEHRSGRWFEKFAVNDEGKVEYQQFDDCHLVKRQPIEI